MTNELEIAFTKTSVVAFGILVAIGGSAIVSGGVEITPFGVLVVTISLTGYFLAHLLRLKTKHSDKATNNSNGNHVK